MIRALLEIEKDESLLAHLVGETSWEGFTVENFIAVHSRRKPTFLRTSNRAELDLILQHGNETQLFQCKLSMEPNPSKVYYELLKSITPDRAWIISPVDEPSKIRPGIWAVPADLEDLEA